MVITAIYNYQNLSIKPKSKHIDKIRIKNILNQNTI